MGFSKLFGHGLFKFIDDNGKPVPNFKATEVWYGCECKEKTRKEKLKGLPTPTLSLDSYDDYDDGPTYYHSEYYGDTFIMDGDDIVGDR